MGNTLAHKAADVGAGRVLSEGVVSAMWLYCGCTPGNPLFPCPLTQMQQTASADRVTWI